MVRGSLIISVFGLTKTRTLHASGIEYWQYIDPPLPATTVKCDPGGEDLLCSACIVPSGGINAAHLIVRLAPIFSFLTRLYLLTPAIVSILVFQPERLSESARMRNRFSGKRDPIESVPVL